MTQLPDDVISIGYKQIRPFTHEQVFSSKLKNFIGTENDFVKAGFGYKYIQISPSSRIEIKD